MEYFSQYGQDRFVDELVFQKKENGFFVDIGAFDGVGLSNTAALERFRNWQGIAVEPIPSRFKQLQANRGCTCLWGGVGPTSGMGEFIHASGYAEMRSAFSKTFLEKNWHLLRQEQDKHGGDVERIQVPLFTFNEIMVKNQVFHIDFLSIDTEGSELDILKSIDFAQWAPICIAIEANYQLATWRFLRWRGYKLVEKIGSDLIFVIRPYALKMPEIGFLVPGEFRRRAMAAIRMRSIRL